MSNLHMNDHYFNLNEAAVLIKKSVQTLRRMIKKGELVAERIKTAQGFQYVITPEALEDLGYNVRNAKRVKQEHDRLILDTAIETDGLVKSVDPTYPADKVQKIEIVQKQISDNDFYVLNIQNIEPDIKNETPVDWRKNCFKEKLFLYGIIEKLQTESHRLQTELHRLRIELRNEKNKSFFSRISLACKKKSS